MKTYSEEKETSLFRFLGYIPNPNYSWRVNFDIRPHFRPYAPKLTVYIPKLTNYGPTALS